MEKVKLGNSGLEVSALCLGTDSIGSKIDREMSFKLLDVYREQGGSFVDTANFYAAWLPDCQGGESETTIGLWMKDRGVRDQMVIDSKLGFDYPGCDGGRARPKSNGSARKASGDYRPTGSTCTTLIVMMRSHRWRRRWRRLIA